MNVSLTSTAIAVERPGGCLTIRLTGDVDFTDRPALDAAVRAAGDGPSDDIRVDLSGSTFIDCAVLGMLDRLSRIADADGHSVVVLDASRAGQRVIALGGLADRIHHHATVG